MESRRPGQRKKLRNKRHRESRTAPAARHANSIRFQFQFHQAQLYHQMQHHSGPPTLFLLFHIVRQASSSSNCETICSWKIHLTAKVCVEILKKKEKCAAPRTRRAKLAARRSLREGQSGRLMLSAGSVGSWDACWTTELH